MDVFSLFAKISLDTSGYEQGLSGASKTTSNFGEKLKTGLANAAKVGAAALTAATAAVTAFAKASIDTGAKFDSSMSQVAATMGTTVDQIQDLRDFAMDMGAKTAFSATEAADALNYMALAGYDAQQSMQALPNVLNLAAAGSIDLAAASDMVTDAQSALGLSMEESAALVDKMAMASSKSNTSVAQLGDAILTIGGTAKNLAGGTTELSTALGILADNGIKGAEGGTALRNIILSLSAPTDKAAASLKKMGVEVYDAAGNMRPLNETFGDLQAALSTMTQGEQTNVLNNIFNKVDLKSVNALLANTGERFDELSGYIDNASGAAERMAATQLDNLTGDITLMKSALEGAQIVISDRLMPSLRGFVQFGTSGITRISDAFKKGGMSGAMSEFGKVLSDGVGIIAEALPQAVEAGMQLLGAVGQGLIDNLPVIADAAGKIGSMLLDTITSIDFSEVGNMAVEMISTFISGITTALPGLAASAVQIISTLANGLAGQLPTLVPIAIDAILQIAETLTDPDNLGNLLDAAIAIILALADGLINSLPKLAEKVPKIVQNIITTLIESAPKLLDAAAELIKKFGGYLVDEAKKLSSIISEIVVSIKNWFIEGVGKLREAGMRLLEGLWSGITDKIDWLKGKVSGVVDTIKSWFTGKEGFDEHSPSKWSESVADLVMRGFGLGFDRGENSLLRTVDGIIDNVMGRFEGMDASNLKIGGAEFGFRKIGSIQTAAVEFQDSALGLTSAAAINAASGNNNASTISLSAQFVTPDGKVMAEYIATPLVDHMNANGTPILNPA